MIEVTGLTKRFGDIRALSDVSFIVEKGQIVGFLGANGAGKTTTMDIICGCIGADQGTAKVAGFDITEHPIEAKRRLGYLPEIAPLHNDMIVTEYIKYVASLHKIPTNQIKAKVDSTVEKLSLNQVSNRVIGNLSKGYRQRVALAQAIVHEPEVLVLDEPTEGLDPNQIAQIRELIRSLAGNHTIILSSHILSEVQNTCDHVIIIHEGKILEQGTCSELATKLQSGQIYRLKVARKQNEAAEALKQLKGITSVQLLKEAGDTLEFSVKANNSETALDELTRVLVNGNFGLRELTLKTKSLEEVFFQLTKE